MELLCQNLGYDSSNLMRQKWWHCIPNLVVLLGTTTLEKVVVWESL